MLLKVESLNKKFGSVIAAKDINFSMTENEIIGVIGSNGAGKTTFCNMITGYTSSDNGKILYKNKNITNKGVQQIKKIGIHRSFQIPQVFDNLSVLENILVSSLVAEGNQNNFIDEAFTIDRRDYAMSMLNKFRLEKNYEKKARELPQGDRKVLDILIAIIGKPSIILLDEPTSGVSTDEKNDIMENILKAISNLNISVLFIEHDMEIVEKFSKRIVAFDSGEIIADDVPDVVLKNNKVIKNIIGISHA